MAELGVVASIIGIAAVGVSLSQKLYNLGSRTAHAAHNIHRIATTVTLFSSSLKHVAQVMDDSSSLHTPAAIDTAMQIVNECTVVFEEVGRILQLASDKVVDPKSQTFAAANDKKRRLSVLQKVKWHFEQPKVEWLIAQLEYLKTTLSVLLQTLILAGVTAKAKSEQTQTRENEERVQRERMHVETLIVARQLSLIVLHQFNDHTSSQSKGAAVAEDGEAPSYSTDETDGALEAPPKQKLLTATPDNESVLSLVRTGMGGNLDFLNSSMPAMPDQSQEDESMSPIMSRSRGLVDQLLGRWTHINRMSDPPTGRLSRMSTFDLEGQSDEAAVQTPEMTSEDESAHPKSGKKTPELKVEGPPKANNRLVPIRSLDIRIPPAMNGHPMTVGGTGAATLPPPPMARPVPPRAATNPDQLAGANTSKNRLEVYNLNTRSLATELPGSLVASPAASPLSTSPAEQRFEADNRPRQRNPRRVSRHDFSSSSDELDSGDDRSRVGGPRMYGLRIPWRIRVGAKYFDFLDASLVGPRRPGLPTESKGWIYGHSDAVTEISSSWVAEEAIAETKLAYSPVKPEEDVNLGQQPDYSWAGVGKHERELKWRIMRPLEFEEIQNLVERTIDLYRSRHQNAARPPINSHQSTPSSRPSSSRDSQTFHPPPIFHQQPHTSMANSKLDPRNSLKSTQTRSISFSEHNAHPAHDTWPRSRSGQFVGSPRLFPADAGPHQSFTNPNLTPAYPHGPPPPAWHGPPTAATFGPPATNNGPPLNGPPLNGPPLNGPPPNGPPRASYPPPPSVEHEHPHPRKPFDYEKDYHHQHIKDEDWNREFDRDRHSHRSEHHRSQRSHSARGSTSSKTHGGKKELSERERREAKRRQRSTAGTLARLGGLAALLEGLDGL